jgi:hypothetical protein
LTQTTKIIVGFVFGLTLWATFLAKATKSQTQLTEQPNLANREQADLLEGIEPESNFSWNSSVNYPTFSKEKSNNAYTIDGTEIRLAEEERPVWGNRGYVEDYSVEVEVYEY